MDLGRIANPWSLVTDGAYQAKVLHEAGIIRPIRPDKALRLGATFTRWGTSPATGAIVSATLYPNEIALIDEIGELTFSELDQRTNALARGFKELGLGPGKGVGLMARNHRGFVETTIAAAKLGASALFLNTRFSGPQLADVMKREGPEILVYDEEFAELLHEVDPAIDRVLAWTDEGTGDPTLEEMIESNDDSGLSPPSEDPHFVILTSGTTGTPKGAQRSSPEGLGAFASLVGNIPYRLRDRMMIAAPLFHSWGFTHFVLALPLSATIVLQRRFKEEETLKAVEEHEAQVLAVVPVMLQRIMNLPEEKLKKYELSSLRVVSLSGSALPGELATKWMDHFGDNLYNLYGSTEVAYATIAGPQDLREAPGTAGRPPRGTIVRLYDEDDNEVEKGQTGRIFVGNDMAFEGYTGGGGKDEIDGLLSSGDVGHFDEEGRLFIDGRDDEMIVSGGENVFPREVEDLLSDHDAVAEAAVIGIEDEEFGQRLKAFVVLADGKDIGEDEVKGHVKENLAGYKTPREVEFIDELPRNATGKIVKRELVEREKEESGREATTGDSMAEASEKQS
jgi:acyl-CoA synthetase (AMP-forming)/AMP-acid ligase II